MIELDLYIYKIKLFICVFFQDLTQIDLEPYMYKGANITSMRLIDPSNRDLKSLTSDWVNKEVNYGRSPLLGSRFIGVSHGTERYLN